MKNIAKKSILQKITITILTVLLLSNFIVPTYSHADWGGALMSPIVDLLCSVGDVVVNLLQKCMTGHFASVGAPDFSFNMFMVEDDEFWANGSGRYSDYIIDSGEAKNIAITETINVDAKDANGKDIGFEKGWLNGSDKYHIPIATYSPEQIFTGNVSGLDINFINPDKSKFGETTDKEGNKIVDSSAGRLQSTIATWYVALRNLTVVGLLSVLVYVGIRIILSSTASDKAKYKQMLVDWLIALCLVFFLHYIMSFVLTMTESICTAIGHGATDIYVQVQSTDNGEGIFKTNLLGLARFKTQYADFGQKMAYLIMYLALVIYTLIFTWFYLKRLLMMAFLTLIAPVVALTYPIDKMNDGKAQAFNSWLKEYVFNALIQPFHLIIYMVFVGSAMDLATTNIIYMIAALGFILSAEKILRKFFGFEKAGAGTLGALASGAAIGSLAKKAIGGAGKAVSGKSSGGKTTEEGDKPPRFERRHDVSQIEANNNIGSEDNQIEESSIPNSELTSHADEFATLSGASPSETNAEYGINENNTTPSGIILPDSYIQRQQQEQARRNREQQAQEEAERIQRAQQQPQEQPQQQNSRLANWTRAHNINGRSAMKLVGRAARFATRTTFKAGAGTLAAAVTLASGGGLAGAAGAFAVGSSVGGRLGNRVADAGVAIGRGAERVVRAGEIYAQASTDEEAIEGAKDALFAGTRLGRELDLANGNTRYQTAGETREWKNNQDNLNYLRDQMAAQNGGVVPSARDVKNQMNSFDPYLAEGLTDIKQMLKAQKAEQFGISGKQSAIIAAIGKEKGITADVLNDNKKAAAQQANLKQDFMNKGYSAADAARQADYTMNVLKVQNGVAHNLQKVEKPAEAKPQQLQQSSQPQQARQPRQPRQPRQTK